MLNSNTKVLEYLDKEIKNLEDAVKKAKTANELLRISIRKKELLLSRMIIIRKSSGNCTIRRWFFMCVADFRKRLIVLSQLSAVAAFHLMAKKWHG